MYAVIDIETTGGSFRYGKITEIAIYLHDGMQVTDEFVTLLNPECNIPANITQLTGITNEMVKGAPKFAEVAEKIKEFTAGKIFVAHSASFDYGFIREEFRRLGQDFTRNTLCTVRFSRKVLPGMRSYSLGNLCSNFNIVINGRHRAGGDAFATTRLLEILFSRDRKNTGKYLVKKNSLDLQVNEFLGRADIEKLPETGGVYYLLSQQEDVHYVGRADNIRTAVTEHFLQDQTQRAKNIKQYTASIRYDILQSELVGNLVREQVIEDLKPCYNTGKAGSLLKYGLFAIADMEGVIRLECRRVKKKETPVAFFDTEEEAEYVLYGAIMKYRLCPAKSGQQPDRTDSACKNYRFGLCNGVCCGEEEKETYNQRVESLLKNVYFKHDSFLLVEEGRHQAELAVIKIENGRYAGLGYVDADCYSDDRELLKGSINHFRGTAKTDSIISSYLRKNSKVNMVILKDYHS